MRPIFTRSSPVALATLTLAALVACGGGDAGLDDLPDGGAATGDDATPAPDAAPAGIELRFENGGVPVADLTVHLHAPGGALLGEAVTDEDGALILDDLPAGGGVTFPGWLVSPQDGLATILGLEPGDRLVIGSEAPAPLVQVAFHMPQAKEGATAYRLGATCQPAGFVNAGQVGVRHLPGDCAAGPTVGVVAYALGPDGHPLAFAALEEIPIDRTDPDAPRAIANLSQLPWRTDFATVAIELSSSPLETVGLVRAWSPDRRRSHELLLHNAFLDEGGGASIAFTQAPGMAGRAESEVMLLANPGGGTVTAAFARSDAAPAAGETLALSVDLGESLPGFLTGVSASDDLATLAIGQPVAHLCDGAVREPIATSFRVRGTVGGEILQWQVLVAGTATILDFPELPAEVAALLWPVAELEDPFADVRIVWQSSQDYAGLRAQRNPFLATFSPRLAADDRYCSAGITSSLIPR